MDTSSVWFNEKAIINKIFLISDDVLYVGDPKDEIATELIDNSFIKTTPPEELLKDEYISISKDKINKIQYNQHHSFFVIEYKKEGMKVAAQSVKFSSPENRDSAFNELKTFLPGFKSNTVEFGLIRSAITPILWAVILGIFTFGLHDAALGIAQGAAVDVSGRKAGMKKLLIWLVEILGPTGVLAVGGILILICFIALVKRVKTPPIVTKLVKQ